MVRSVKVFIPMGGLFVIETILYHTGIYEFTAFLKIPLQTLCRVGIAALCAWALVCNDKVKGQLMQKYPHGIGRLMARWTGGGARVSFSQ